LRYEIKPFLFVGLLTFFPWVRENFWRPWLCWFVRPFK